MPGLDSTGLYNIFIRRYHFKLNLNRMESLLELQKLQEMKRSAICIGTVGGGNHISECRAQGQI